MDNRSHVRVLVVLCVVCLLSAPCAWAAGRKYELEIPSATADVSLKILARQTGFSVIFQSDEARSVHTYPIAGYYTIELALAAMLEQTNLSYGLMEGDVIAITRATPETTMVGASNMRQTKSPRTSFLKRLSAAVASIFAVTAIAQTENYEKPIIEEVVVTATKRGEVNLQDIPMSISAISEVQLEIRGADDMLDYLTLIPGVNFRLRSASGGRDDIRGGRHLSLRGIESGPDGVPTTAFYIDDTPIPIMDPKLFDIARVEVLRGPQGTLYGANSMGGTLRIVTNRPNLERVEYKVDTTAAMMPKGDPSFSANVMINAPLGATAALRAVTFYREEGGFIDIVDQFSPKTGVTRSLNNDNDEQVKGARVALAWQPTDALTITPSVFYQKINVDGPPQYEPDSGDLKYVDKRVPEDEENDFTLWNLEIGYDFGNVALFSSTGYFESGFSSTEDVTKIFDTFGLPADPYQSIIQDISSERFTEEVRFTGIVGESINWILGVFYMDEKRLFNQLMLNDGLQWLFPPETILFDGVQTNNDKRTAVFGEVTWTLNEAWEITGGLRWFHDKQDQLAVFDGLFNGGFSSETGKSSESAVSPKLQVAYHPNADNMLYGLVAKGFRPGGPTNSVPADICGDDLAALGLSKPLSQFDSDTLWNYEAGYKGTLAGGRLTLNTAAFFIDWTNVQQSVRLDCGFGFVGNVGAAESKGVEVEFTAQATDNFRLLGSFGYTDAKFTETSAEVGVKKGNRIANTAKITAALSAQYHFPVSDKFQGYVQATAQHIGNRLIAQGLVSTKLPAYDTVELRLGMLSNKWEVIVFAKNLTDERGLLTYTINQPFNLDHVNVIRPRTFGVQFRYFGGR